jgi:DMSO/TMAO reductase YedYZ molybdopterin-dependent catalytic subunit
LRGPWLTSVLGLVLLLSIPVMFVTGMLSYTAYNPRIRGNDITPDAGWLRLVFFNWPTHPSWLYRFTQGLHVTLGVVLVPVILAKLWSVIPKLFEFPPIRSVAHALERISLLLLVGGAVFEFVTGILNTQYWYPFPTSFYTAHLYGAWIFFSAFVMHAALKFPLMRRSLKSRSIRQELRTPTRETVAEPFHEGGLVSPNPAKATLSRRGALGLVGAGSALMFVTAVGQNVGGSLRRLAFLSPRGQSRGNGPNDFQINQTAADVGVRPEQTTVGWVLEIPGPTPLRFTRSELMAMELHTAHLPIACVEGWSTGTQRWTGVRLRDLAAMAGVPKAHTVFVESLQRGGFGATTLAANQIDNPDSLLALQVNGEDLSLDHGYPARVIVPANPGVHNTKWVTKLTFEAPH